MQEVSTLFPLILTPLVFDSFDGLDSGFDSASVEIVVDVEVAAALWRMWRRIRIDSWITPAILSGWGDGLIFDDNSHPLTFSKRLARENRWAHWLHWMSWKNTKSFFI